MDINFADCVGFMIVVLVIASAWIYTGDALKTYKEMKQEERAENIKRHPILASIVTGLIAWKAFDIWNRSRQANHDSNNNGCGNDDKGEGRSVYEDLNM